LRSETVTWGEMAAKPRGVCNWGEYSWFPVTCPRV
jgi:hypothetical protein